MNEIQKTNDAAEYSRKKCAQLIDINNIGLNCLILIKEAIEAEGEVRKLDRGMGGYNDDGGASRRNHEASIFIKGVMAGEVLGHSGSIPLNYLPAMFGGYIVDSEKEERRKMYEELKKEFENDF